MDAAEQTMRSTYWWGIPTLLAAEHDPDPAGCDIALVGVPHSSGNGSTERDQPPLTPGPPMTAAQVRVLRLHDVT